MRRASLFAYLSIDCPRDIKIVNAKEKPMTCLGKTENTASDFDAPPSIRPFALAVPYPPQTFLGHSRLLLTV